VALVGLGSARAQSGEVVGAFELAAPPSEEFILRGTLPIPRGTFPRADGATPFEIRNYDGTLSPAQVEVVTWYPDATDGADVVELLARVRRNPTVTPGNYVRFEIVDSPHAWRRPRLTASVDALRQTPFGIELRTRDVFGNLYRADLRRGEFSRDELRLGSEVQELRCYDVLQPVSPTIGPTATLPHMMSAHSYVSYWARENVITLDVRIHNAASGNDKSLAVPWDDAQAKMYFDSLDLIVPQGWTVLQDFEDPFFGPATAFGNRTKVPLVKPNANGKPHVIGQQAQFERRLAICPVGNEARAREFLDCAFLGFCRKGVNVQNHEYFSWWNPQTARYFPQRHLLPMLDHLTLASIRAKLRNDLNAHTDAVLLGTSEGQYPLDAAALGWAHPWGVAYGGMTSGNEIYLYDGVPTAIAASNEGYRYMSLRHRLYTDRMPDALFDKDGRPTSLQDWVVHGPQFDYVPSLFFQVLLQGYDMFGFSTAPTHHVAYVAANGLEPDYEPELLSYMPIDLQHLGRYLNSPKVLVWLGNDAMAKDDLLMQAEISRLSYHDMPTSASGTAIVSGMATSIAGVNAHPHVGFAFGRGHGWSIDAMCAAYSFQDAAWRAQAKEWFDDVVWLVGQGQASCTGVIQAQVSSKFLNAQHRARQSIEQAIVENALWSMRECVYKSVDAPRLADLEGTLVRSLYSMIGFPGWSTTQNAPWSVLAVGPLDILQPLYCTSLPSGGTDGIVDRYQTPSSFAYGWELTGDPLFLDRAIDMQGVTFPDLYTAMHAGGLGANIENKVAATALSEVMSYP
jgi:hypothetical protein